MHIFQDKEDRTVRCRLQQHGEQGFKGLLPLALGRKRQGWMVVLYK